MSRRGATLLALAAVLGCAQPATLGSTHSGHLYLQSLESVHGQIVGVRSDSSVVVGELLACESRAVYLRVDVDGPRWVELTRSEWRAVEVVDTQHYVTASVWTGVGAVSTLSHGLWLTASAPVWALVGGISIGASGPQSESLEACSVEVRALARWPQGLPAAVRGRFRRLGPDLRFRRTAPPPPPRAPWDS
jgi:hypothetical protein